MIKKRDFMKNIVEVVKRFMGNKHALAVGFRSVVALIITILIGAMFFWIVTKLMQN